MKYNFAVFILTHGRADNVITYKSLRKSGYTGQIYLLIDNEDAQIEQYKTLYGKQVLVFDKQDAIDITDACDNLRKRNSVVFARNYNFKIAKELGLDYFWQLDDDYSYFAYRSDNDHNYIFTMIHNLDAILESMVDFMKLASVDSMAFSQSGDFIGGGNGSFFKKIAKGEFSRKIMNSFLFKSDNPIQFLGRINEDVNAYVTLGARGKLFITVPRLCLQQKITQSNSGGLTDIYLDLGTYVKSFYSIMVHPSSVSLIKMGNKDMRIHHQVKWRNTAPKILSEGLKK